MTLWRPSNIRQQHIDIMQEYMKLCWDEWEVLKKSYSEGSKWSSESFDNRLRVKLPSYAWYINYIRNNYDKELKISKATLFERKAYWEGLSNEWRSEKDIQLYKDFSDSLRELLSLQEEMLQNWAVSWRYNPVISKMLLMSNHWYVEKVETINTTTNINTNVETLEDLKKLDSKQLEELRKKALLN